MIAPMPSRTISVTITATPNEVYAYAANPENLPRWVPSFCRSVKRINNDWVVESPLGPAIFRFVESNSFGVLNHVVKLAPASRCIVRCGSSRTAMLRGDFHPRLVESDLHRFKDIIERRPAR